MADFEKTIKRPNPQGTVVSYDAGQSEDVPTEGGDFLSPEAQCRTDFDITPANYAPMLAEWLVVPRWQRWANWWRSAEVGVRGMYDPVGFVHRSLRASEGGEIVLEVVRAIDPSSLSDFVNDLAFQLGHREPIGDIVEHSLWRAVAEYDYSLDSIIFDQAVFRQFIEEARSVTSRKKLIVDVGTELITLHVVLSHEIYHRDSFYPFLASKYRELAIHAMSSRDVDRKMIAKVITRRMFQEATRPRTNFSADAKVVFAQRNLAEKLRKRTFETEAGAHLIGELCGDKEGMLKATYSTAFQSEIVEVVTPAPLRNRPVKDIISRFNDPCARDIPFHFAYAAARSRAVISAFRSLELAGNLAGPVDVFELYRVIEDPFQDGADVAFQGTITMASMIASVVGSIALFAVKKSAYLRLAVPAAAISAALYSGKEAYDTWRRDETSGEEKFWSTTAVAGSAAAAGASIGLGIASGELATFVVAGSAAAASSGGILLPVILVAGLGVFVVSQIVLDDAKEERVAAQLADAFIKRDFEKLAELSADPHFEFDDDAAMELLEEYLIPQGLLNSSEIWRDSRLQPFRLKLIQELGSGYAGDLEAAFRLFVARYESKHLAWQIREEMDSGELETYTETFQKYKNNATL